jgi:uncharacterized protein YndB with AHSA1/START domain
MAKLQVTVEPDSQNINMVVTLQAPLEKVYRAYTERDILVKWWAQGQPFDVDYFVPGPGGKWRYVQKAPDGTEYAFHGCFHAMISNVMAIQTFEFEGLPEPGHVALDRADFVALSDDTTEVHITSTFQSVADRDGMVASGMEGGFRQSIEALGRLIEPQ